MERRAGWSLLLVAAGAVAARLLRRQGLSWEALQLLRSFEAGAVAIAVPLLTFGILSWFDARHSHRIGDGAWALRPGIARLLLFAVIVTLFTMLL